MNNPPREGKTSQYKIVVEGNLDTLWELWFEGMKITSTNDGKTIISGAVIDQSELHGILEKIHSLNLTLISVLKINMGNESKP